MIAPLRPCDNPFNAQRIDALDYIEFDHKLADVTARLRRQDYRGSIVGPHGSGKSALMDAVGEALMLEHGLSPLPLFINSDQRGQLPADWRRTIRRAKPTDALLLDGYDLLPMWARAWVILRSKSAGAVVVTTHRDVYWDPIARPISSATLLERLINELTPANAPLLDAGHLFESAEGNLRDALRLAYDLHGQQAAQTLWAERYRNGVPARSHTAA